MTTKDEAISRSYYDLAGFGFIISTLKDALKFNSTVTYADVKAWKQTNVERKTNLRGFNSFIAEKPFEEFQIDLFFTPDLKADDYIGGLLFIDIYTKYVVVIPIESKTPNELLDALKEGFSKMGGFPKTMLSDNEGSFNSTLIKSYLTQHNIRQIFTLGHASYAERAIRTIKSMIYKRIEKHKAKWTELLFSVLLTYNHKLIHTSIGMTPNEARQSSNQMNVSANLELHRIHKRKYPNIKEGDWVKLLKKKKHFDKEHISTWTPQIYKVTGIVESMGQHFYKVNGYDKLLLRSDILLTESK